MVHGADSRQLVDRLWVDYYDRSRPTSGDSFMIRCIQSISVFASALVLGLTPALAAAPNVAHLGTKEREQVLLCERVNAHTERELRTRGYMGASLEGMCMFGSLQPTSWYSCMDSQLSRQVPQAKAAAACRQYRVEPGSQAATR